MKTENFAIEIKFDTKEAYFMTAIKDRTVFTEERWIVASLSKEEAKELYKYLGNYFEDKD